ncbi:MAG: hypothetical protein EPN53_16750 [Acidobacteria bacterium]|nr:MAG: hypothetical protein EPN53_16750 [Acidobacteriota bacterium]
MAPTSEIPPALREMIERPAAWARVRALRWGQLQAALEHPHLSAEIRDGVIGDLEDVGALAFMRAHPSETLGDALEQLIANRN